MVKKFIAEILKTEKLNSLAEQYVSTPLEYHSRVSQDFQAEIYIKREDRIDDFGCGNKLRKLSYIIPHAIEMNSTILITAGSLPSNQCKAVAKLAQENNLRAHVVFGGDNQILPHAAHGNYLLTTLLEPTISWFENSPWKSISEKINIIAEEEKRKGERPYIIDSGASAWPGLLGSIELGFELAVQVKEKRLSISDIVVPAGSGGTCLGIKIAAEILQLPWRVFGICIGENAVAVKNRTLTLRKEAANYINYPIDKDDGLLIFTDFAIGKGYDKAEPEELNLMQKALREYQLILDPNYMLKTFIGLKKLLFHNQIKEKSGVVLVHTGGQFGLFDNGLRFSAWHQKRYSSLLK